MKISQGFRIESQVSVVFDANRPGENGRDTWGPDTLAVDDCTLNQAFDLLSNQRRRYVLEILYTAPETVLSVGDLADRVLAGDPDATDRERVLVGLHHKVLPRLADDGVIDFDLRTETVRYHGSELTDTLLAELN